MKLKHTLKHIIITLIAALSITSNLACTEEVEKPVPKQEVEEPRSVEEPQTEPQEPVDGKPEPVNGQIAKVTDVIEKDGGSGLES